MSNRDNRKIGDLCTLIANLGQEGGVISPSVYDTAQALRFFPPEEGVEPALQWLAGCQMADGGWGNSVRPHTRDVPTIAAILAFAAYPLFSESEKIIESGLAFLEKHHKDWEEVVPEDLPVGMELILPKLLSEAERYGLNIPQNHYQNLIPIYQKKIGYIQSMPLGKGSPATYSWEAWGESPDKKWLDYKGGVGHSPTATAFWAFLAKNNPDLKPEREHIKNYLSAAANSTQTGIPGVLPTAWPINRFEQSFALHTLLMADLLDHPELEEEIQKQIDDLMHGVQPTGVGFSDIFNPDGDDTAAAVAVLCSAGKSVAQDVLDHFAHENHYRAYAGELQASHSVTARAIYALRHYGVDTTAAEHYLLSHQLTSGAWPGDKWNVSQYYGTCLATFALKDKCNLYRSRLKEAAQFLIDSQLADGGWGASSVSRITDTSYALLSLLHLTTAGVIGPETFLSGQKWLHANYESQRDDSDLRWLNKQEYSPFKIDQTFHLAAMVLVSEHVSL